MSYEGDKAAYAHENALLRDEIERLKDRIDEHHRMFEPMHARIAELEAALELLLEYWQKGQTIQIGSIIRAALAKEGKE